jgi:hypothetical protein
MDARVIMVADILQAAVLRVRSQRRIVNAFITDQLPAKSPSEIEERVASRFALSATAPDTPGGQVAMASKCQQRAQPATLWCKQNGLRVPSRGHRLSSPIHTTPNN